ncbi:MAG: lipoprotein insertase outer membrane protein LolB [Steroidobacteraceae bacterium]
MIRVAAACAFLALAGGCVSLPPPVDAGSWPARRAELQALESWTLDGRVAVATADEGFSGGFAWRQQGATAAIELRGPLGGKALSIRLDGAQMTVTDANGASIAGDAARAYVASEIGAPLPIAELRYWLVGVPAPDRPHQENIGADGRLSALEQAGWRLRYARYDPVGRLVLPARIEIESETARLRLVVSRWRLPP